jgi:formyltetrahydrofolate deformylase
LIISNHPDLQPVSDHFNIPFAVFKITKETKEEQEKKEIAMMVSLYSPHDDCDRLYCIVNSTHPFPSTMFYFIQEEHQIDLVVLARYMQIVSDHFCKTFETRCINIHHSFLPAFMGSKPYHRAHERGVKLIGATAHYATVELDEGPIIEQDIIRISHRDEVSDLLRKGRTLEKNVLINAVKAHVEDRIIVYNNKCVVFGN